MWRVLLRLALWLSASLILPVFATRALPYPIAEPPGFLMSPVGCSKPCFLGIRPGITTLHEAFDLLRTHAWVDSVEIQFYEMDVRGLRATGLLTWRWSDAHPAMIDDTSPGRMSFTQSPERTLIDGIYLQTLLRPYELQHAFGVPDSSIAASNNDETVSHLLIYNNRAIKTELRCPATLLDYWNSHAEIVMYVARAGNAQGVATVPDVVRMCSIK